MDFKILGQSDSALALMPTYYSTQVKEKFTLRTFFFFKVKVLFGASKYSATILSDRLPMGKVQ